MSVAAVSAALDEDVERVMSELAPMRITAATDDESRELAVRATEVVHDAVATSYGCPVRDIEEVLLGDGAVQAPPRWRHVHALRRRFTLPLAPRPKRTSTSLAWAHAIRVATPSVFHPSCDRHPFVPFLHRHRALMNWVNLMM